MPEIFFSRAVYHIVNKVTLQSLLLICNTCVFKQGTKFKFISRSHTIIESNKRFGYLPYVTVINCLWNSKLNCDYICF